MLEHESTSSYIRAVVLQLLKMMLSQFELLMVSLRQFTSWTFAKLKNKFIFYKFFRDQGLGFAMDVLIEGRGNAHLIWGPTNLISVLALNWRPEDYQAVHVRVECVHLWQIPMWFAFERTSSDASMLLIAMRILNLGMFLIDLRTVYYFKDEYKYYFNKFHFAFTLIYTFTLLLSFHLFLSI